MKNLIALVLVLILVSCANQKRVNEVVLEYQDFGPQVIAYEIIGMEWWQWNEHGDSRPTQYDIRVVVYMNTSLEEIERRYPIIENEKQDFRYLEYQEAIEYLNNKIEEDAIPSVTERLKITLNKLYVVFGEIKS